jgi:hypothetical protein
MNPLGIAIAFLLFGLVVGAGVFLVVNNLNGLYSQRALHLSAAHTLESYSLRDMVALIGRFLLVLLGVAMIYQGALWVYIVVFR